MTTITQRTNVNDNGVSTRGFRTFEAANNYAAMLLDTGRADAVSNPNTPNSCGIYAVAWRELETVSTKGNRT